MTHFVPTPFDCVAGTFWSSEGDLKSYCKACGKLVLATSYPDKELEN